MSTDSGICHMSNAVSLYIPVYMFDDTCTTPVCLIKWMCMTCLVFGSVTNTQWKCTWWARKYSATLTGGSAEPHGHNGSQEPVAACSSYAEVCRPTLISFKQVREGLPPLWKLYLLKFALYILDLYTCTSDGVSASPVVNLTEAHFSTAYCVSLWEHLWIPPWTKKMNAQICCRPVTVLQFAHC